jgi:glycosyltransferase involved in cell wall biosynthesis
MEGGRVAKLEADAFALIVAASLPPPVAGQSVATSMLIDRLDADGVDYQVVDLSSPLKPRRAELVRRISQVALFPGLALVRSWKLRGSPVLFYLQVGQSPRALLRDLPLLWLARQLGWRTVIHIHGGGFRQGLDACSRWHRRLITAELAQVRCAIVLSERLRSLLAGIVDARRIVAIPNGVEPEVERRAQSAVPKSELFTALFLSNLIESKGYGTFLEAAKLAQSRRLPIRFVLAGSPTWETPIDPGEYIERNQLTNIEFKGAVYGVDKLRAFEEAHAFVLPTAYPVEGQPISVLEALHFGLAVVTTSVGGLLDVIEDGANGSIIPPGDAEALLDALEQLASSPPALETMRCRNRERARQLYTSHAHSDAMLDTLRQVASEVTG